MTFYQNGSGTISKHVFVNDRVENVKNVFRTFKNDSLEKAIMTGLETSGQINRRFIKSFTGR